MLHNYKEQSDYAFASHPASPDHDDYLDAHPEEEQSQQEREHEEWREQLDQITDDMYDTMNELLKAVEDLERLTEAKENLKIDIGYLENLLDNYK